MTEYSKGHYLDLEERRDFYKQRLGDPINTDIYNYYINMIGEAIEHRSKDADFNRTKFPYSVGTRQELVRVMMIVQDDAKKATEASFQINQNQVVAPPPSMPTKKRLFPKWRKK